MGIYLEMDETDRKDPAKIKNHLREAFCDGPFVAYAKLSSKKWGEEEVDVYANEIRRLAGLARFEGPSLEHIVNIYKRSPRLYECTATASEGYFRFIALGNFDKGASSDGTQGN